MASWKTPTQEQIELAVAHLKGNLKSQFFAKLENPEWFAPLNERGLLSPRTITGDDGKDGTEWFAIPYLRKVSAEIPDAVISIMQPILDDMNEGKADNTWLIHMSVFNIAPNMPDAQFVKLMGVFNNWINKTQFVGWLDIKDFSNLLERLKGLDKALSLAMVKNILTLFVLPKKDGEFFYNDPQSKFAMSGNMDSYEYGKILKSVQNLFYDSAVDLFDIFYQILTKDMLALLSEEESKNYEYAGYARRPAIEEHSQNISADDTEYKLVSALRDSALNILRNGTPEQIKHVFDTLESGGIQITTRLILHLLRMGDNNEDLLNKYITNNDIFGASAYHYEYFHMIQDKWDNLSVESQNIIFGYIDAGPTGEWYEEDNEKVTSQQKKDYWRRERLEPIREKLSAEQIEKYKSILLNEDGTKKPCREHPDMLTWTSSFIRRVGGDSPLGLDAVSEKSVEEIVKYVNKWEPNQDTFDEPSVGGLAAVLQKDAQANPLKYIDSLEQIKGIANPAYIYHILMGLSESGEKTNIGWMNIFDFAVWLSDQQDVPNEKQNTSYSNRNFYYAKTTMARLITAAFNNKENLKDIDDETLGKAFAVLSRFVLEPDEVLDERAQKEQEKDVRTDSHLNSAINVLHGTALEGIIEFALWCKNNDKPAAKIADMLDTLLAQTSYMESFAILGRMLPWLHYALKDWTEKNLDNLLPESEDKRNIFDATWFAYIFYSRIFDDSFNLLENKYKYVLRTKLYADDKDYKREEKRISQGLVVHYARGLFGLDSELLTLIFDVPANAQEQHGFINYIGFSLWNQDKKGNETEIPKEIIDRFIAFWEWLLIHIAGKENDYVDALSQFERWYQCGKFPQEWIVNQVHNLVCNHNIPMCAFMIKDVLLADLSFAPRMVFEIVSKLALSKKDRWEFFDVKAIETIVKYIKENDVPGDAQLKIDKDAFINKYLEKCEPYEVEQNNALLAGYREDICQLGQGNTGI